MTVLNLWRSLRIQSSLVLALTVVASCSGPKQQEPLKESAAVKHELLQTDPKTEEASEPSTSPQEDFQARFDAAAKAILYISPDAFPQLPDTVKSTLRSLKCAIPQPTGSGPQRNVIRGDFFTRGQMSWAVLCSVGGFSSILVFRDNLDAHPEELERSEDKGYLQNLGNNVIGYSREITAVDRNMIMTSYREHGGPEPPPIDHQGIDDAFLEKASVIHYWYEGEWLKLQGSD
jgi:hypothetical protein